MYKKLANALKSEERFEQAKTYYKMAISTSPEKAFQAYAGLAVVYRRSQENQEELSVYRQMQNIFPHFQLSWLGEIRIHLDHSDRAAAEKTLKIARQWLGKSAANGMEYSDLLDHLGYFQEAIEHREKYLDQLSTENPDLCKILRKWLNHGRIGCVFQIFDRLSEPIPPPLTALHHRLNEVLKYTQASAVLANQRAAKQPITLNELVITQIIKQIPTVQDNGHLRPKIDFACRLINDKKIGMGGAERQLATLVQALDQVIANKLPISLLVAHDEPSLQGAKHFFGGLGDKALSVFYYNKPAKRPVIDFPSKEILQLLPDSMQQHIYWLYQRLYQHPPKILNIWKTATLFPSSIAALLAGIPRVIIFARGEPIGAAPMSHTNSVVQNEEVNLLRIVLSLPNFSLCCNSHSSAKAYANRLDYDLEKIHLLYNGIDLNWLEESNRGYSTARERARLGIPASAKVVGSIFWMEWRKQPILWLRTAAAIRDRLPDVEIHFLLVGDGSLFSKIRALSEELGLAGRLHLVGRSTTVKVWLEMMDLFLFTSQTEGLPNALIEAQSYGVPVVSTDAGGAKETFIHAETGWLVEQWDADTLAEKVVWCLNNPNWLERATILAKGQAQRNFSVSSMLRGLQDIWGVQVIS